MGGPRPGGGRSKMISFMSPSGEKCMLNKEEIMFAEFLDSQSINWERNQTIGFPYIDLEGRNRKFYPDFLCTESNTFLEYKGCITDHMIHKMKEAKLNNNFKLIIIYSDKYKEHGITLSEIKQNPKIFHELLDNVIC